MLADSLEKAIGGKDLSQTEAYYAVKAMLGGEMAPVQMAALLTALRMKGLSCSELIGAGLAFKESLEPWARLENGFLSMDREEINLDRETIERTSLPGDRGTATFNVSTATALVVAGAGAKVVRHASLIPSQRVGTEHVIRELGIQPEVTPSLARRCLEETGVAFLYSSALNRAARLVYQVRMQLGFRTLLNVAGPLSNPCGAGSVYLGVYEISDLTLFPRVTRALGVEKGMLVHGDHTLDEASITGTTRVCVLGPSGNQVKELVPEDLGLSRCKPEDLRGGTARENALVIREILKGSSGPKRNLVLLNSALALTACGRAKDEKEGLAMAAESIDSSAALRSLELLVRLSNEQGYFRKAE
jgi:anthranilate phosphoribosyltransferase